MKHCGKCKVQKPFDQFHRSSRSSTGRQSWCIDCSRDGRLAYYRDNKAKHKIAVRAHSKEFAKWKASLKAGKPCTDCKQIFHFAVMQWDHLPQFEKAGNVGQMYSKKNVLEEIAKCELVCANCHAFRTYTRQVAQVEQPPLVAGDSGSSPDLATTRQ